jgi:hypothetical protein
MSTAFLGETKQAPQEPGQTQLVGGRRPVGYCPWKGLHVEQAYGSWKDRRIVLSPMMSDAESNSNKPHKNHGKLS